MLGVGSLIGSFVLAWIAGVNRFEEVKLISGFLGRGGNFRILLRFLFFFTNEYQGET